MPVHDCETLKWGRQPTGSNGVECGRAALGRSGQDADIGSCSKYSSFSRPNFLSFSAVPSAFVGSRRSIDPSLLAITVWRKVCRYWDVLADIASRTRRMKSLISSAKLEPPLCVHLIPSMATTIKLASRSGKACSRSSSILPVGSAATMVCVSMYKSL